jgi:4-amino-4-deoxy-L-arabinose transferase-like glycosyltransferase
LSFRPQRAGPSWAAAAPLLGLISLFLIGLGPGQLRLRGDDNLYVAQARSFLRGQLALDRDYQDVARYGGKLYCAFPPLPALLLVPFVAVFGGRFNTPLLLTLLATAITARLLYRMLARDTRAGDEAATWLTAAFILGSGYWMVSIRTSGVWFIAQVIGVAFCVLTLHEILGKRRAWVLGLSVGAAFLCRQLTILYAPLAATSLWLDTAERPTARRLGSLATFAAALAVPVVLQLALNALRFSGPLDSGYRYMDMLGFGGLRVAAHGLFSLAYAAPNFWVTYFQGPHLELSPPDYMHVAGMDPFGTSLTFASPFVFLALRGEGPKAWRVAAWATVAAIAFLGLCYFNNGYHQTNCARFTLDFLPIVVVLAGLGWRRCPPAIAKASVVYAIGLNAFALVVVTKFLSGH